MKLRHAVATLALAGLAAGVPLLFEGGYADAPGLYTTYADNECKQRYVTVVTYDDVQKLADAGRVRSCRRVWGCRTIAAVP